MAQKTESIARAVTYLGIENLKGLLMAAQIFGSQDFPDMDGMSASGLRDEALLTGTLARKMVKDPKSGDAAFAAGIVHDVGQIVLARDPTRRYGDVLRASQASGEPLQVVEQRELGVTHGIVGAYLLGVWGLPFLIAETVAFHHTPSAVTEGNLDLLGAVHVADAVVSAAFRGRDPMTDGMLDLPFVERMGLDVPKWHAKAVAALSPDSKAA
jgi:HD-like signal output (HDOD) protein